MTQNNFSYFYFINFWRKPVLFFDFFSKILVLAIIFFIPLHSPTTKTLIYIFLVTWFLSGGYQERWRVIARHPWVWVSVALYILICIGSLYGGNDEVAISRQLRAYATLLFPIFVLPLFLEDRWRRWAFYSFMAAMALTLVLSMMHAVWQFPLPRAALDGSSEGHNIFKSHITQNVMMSLFLLGSILLSQQSSHFIAKSILVVVSCVAIINITFLVIGRTGYFTLIWILLVSYCFVVPKEYKWRILLVAFFLGAGIVIFSPHLVSRLSSIWSEVRAYQGHNEITSTGARLEYWRRSVELIQEQPLWGFGTGSWVAQFCRVSSPAWCSAWSTVHPHNQFLHMGVQLGGLGVLCLMLYYGVAAKLSWAFTPRDRAWLLGIWGALMIMSMVDVPLYILDEGRFFPLMLAVFFAGYDISRRPAKAHNFLLDTTRNA